MEGQNTSILSFAKQKKSRNRILAELVAFDNFTLNQIVKSSFLRNVFHEYGWEMPKNATTISTILLNEAEKKKIAIQNEIRELIEENVRFSVIIDEWTSISSKRFMSVILRSHEQTFNLGMASINGTANSSNLNNILWDRLKVFSIEKKHIVAIVTDGASVMKSMLAINDCVQQRCMAHGFHLAVKDSFFRAENEHDDDETNCSDSEANENDDLATLDSIINCIFFDITRYFEN